MNAHTPPQAWLLLLAGALSAGCDAHGVDVGTEELCVKDARLVQAEQRAESEQVSSCAAVGENQLENPGFEAPSLASSCNALFCQLPADEVPGWTTSSSEPVVEIWLDGYLGIEAPEGAQFAELNADSRDTLSQDLMLAPGQLMLWSILHRGRNGIDSMELRIGPSEAPVTQATLPSPEDAWYEYSGLYRVGDGETMTRLALVSRSGTNEGNLVDAVVFAPVN